MRVQIDRLARAAPACSHRGVWAVGSTRVSSTHHLRCALMQSTRQEWQKTCLRSGQFFVTRAGIVCLPMRRLPMRRMHACMHGETRTCVHGGSLTRMASTPAAPCHPGRWRTLPCPCRVTAAGGMPLASLPTTRAQLPLLLPCCSPPPLLLLLALPPAAVSASAGHQGLPAQTGELAQVCSSQKQPRRPTPVVASLVP